ncbi:MAG: phosphoribosylformylglycinamidine synthase subunit PurS [Thermotogaceae bacterium]|jgi:phosphoribosylformylglycinamidine synthase|nr:phosphoribosylformylglycinamidine synthase subunit PurS [Thermotogaceae bacterium]MDN5337474.1 phosphoribosylformylglycinamidine synthase subunit PurS [Thermotogaceae bacterium]
MRFIARIVVEPKDGVLDPQGKASMKVVKRLGYEFVDDIRVGKHITVEIQATNKKMAEKIASELAYKIFTNPVLEKYEVSVFEMKKAEVIEK